MSSQAIAKAPLEPIMSVIDLKDARNLVIGSWEMPCHFHRRSASGTVSPTAVELDSRHERSQIAHDFADRS